MLSIQTDVQFTQTKNVLHKYVSLITGIVAIPFAALNILLEQFDIATIDFLFSALNIFFFWAASKNKSQPWHINAAIFCITFTILYASNSADLRAGTVYWLLLLPPIYCILKGPKIGLLYTLLLIFPIYYILFSKSDSDSLIPYRTALNFSAAYFLTYIICYCYESQYIKNSKSLHQMAYKDPLTGARNRHALKIFFEHFNKSNLDENNIPSINTRNGTQLLILDIDYFKKINDRFGHEIGDIILIEMSEILQKKVKEENLYRIGGEEFLVTLQGASSTQACDMAEMLRKKVEQHTFNVEGNRITLTVSIGVSELKQGENFNSFLRNADQNLYHAKNQGRNNVSHDQHCFSEAT